MLKSYKELMAVDIKPFCHEKPVNKKGDTIEYLNWAKCVDLLHENGAEVVYFEPLINERDGSSVFSTEQVFKNSDGRENQCYEVRVKVVIDELEFVQSYPIIQGKNAVYSDGINQFVVDYCQKRAFVKGVAIRTGLGLCLWIKEDDIKTDVPVEPMYIYDIQRYTQELYSKLLYQYKIPQEDIIKELGLPNFDVVKGQFSKFDELAQFIKKLQEIERKK